MIDYSWSDVYAIDQDLRKYIIDNKTPVLLIANLVPSHMIGKGFPEGSTVISASTGTLVSQHFVDALDIMLHIDEKSDVAEVQAKMNDIHRMANSTNFSDNFDSDFTREVYVETKAIRSKRREALSLPSAAPTPGMA